MTEAPQSTAGHKTAMLSFPKCGRTWLKLMLKVYYEHRYGITLDLDKERNWHSVDHRLPKLRIEHDGNPHFQSVAELKVDRSRYKDQDVILIVRDPRDVIVSLFFEMTKRTRFYKDWGFDTSRVTQQASDMSEFIRGPVGRLDTLLAYYTLWGQARTEGPFHLVRYEDMHADTAAVLTAVVTAIDESPVDREAVLHAVEFCQFDKMRRYEKNNAFKSKTLVAGDKSDPESFKVRKGQVGGYTEYLSAEDIAYIDERCAKLPDYLSDYRKGCAR